MSEKAQSFVRDCLNDAKPAAKGAAVGATVGYAAGAPFGLGGPGAIIGGMAGARIGDKLDTYRQVRERREQGGNS